MVLLTRAMLPILQTMAHASVDRRSEAPHRQLTDIDVAVEGSTWGIG